MIVVLDFIFAVMVVKHCSILALLPCLPVCPPSLLPQLFYIFIFLRHWWIPIFFSRLEFIIFLLCFVFGSQFRIWPVGASSSCFLCPDIFVEHFCNFWLNKMFQALLVPLAPSPGSSFWGASVPVTTWVSLPLILSELVLLFQNCFPFFFLNKSNSALKNVNHNRHL